jgi:hypothetical protein
VLSHHCDRQSGFSRLSAPTSCAPPLAQPCTRAFGAYMLFCMRPAPTVQWSRESAAWENKRAHHQQFRLGLRRVHGAATAQPIPIVHRASKYGQRVHEATSMVTCIDTARVSTVRCLKSVSAARSRSSLRVQPAAAHIREHAPYRKTRNRTSCDNLANAPHRMQCAPYTRPNTPPVETINIAPHPAVPKPVAISRVMSAQRKFSAVRCAALVVLMRALPVARCLKHQGCTSGGRVLQTPKGTRGYERARLRRLSIGLVAFRGKPGSAALPTSTWCGCKWTPSRSRCPTRASMRSERSQHGCTPCRTPSQLSVSVALPVPSGRFSVLPFAPFNSSADSQTN